MTTAAGNYNLFKMEKSEKVEVREFEMETKELDKMLSRKLSTTNRPRHTTLKIQVLNWDRHKYVVGLNR
jgi:hypothetical protein